MTAAPGNQTLARPTIPRMREILDRVDGGRVLNVGCVADPSSLGQENWLHGHLDTVADELIGVDIDEAGIATMQEHGWDARVDDARTLETIEEPVDVVVAGEVIEHLMNPGAFLEAARDALGPDGQLLLTTPNVWAAVHIRRIATGYSPGGEGVHVCWYDEMTLREALRRSGFEGTITHVEPMGTGISSLAHRVRAKLGGTRLLADVTPVGQGADAHADETDERIAVESP